MKPFADIYARAQHRKGGEEALQALLPSKIKTPPELRKTPSDRILSAMTLAIFQAGFSWKVVQTKWPGFEEAFWKFNIKRCAFMSPEDVESLCVDARVIRNGHKIQTVPLNAQMIFHYEQEAGDNRFATLLADWPAEDFIGLLKYLKNQGSRLGGTTSQYFLRHLGKDGFVLGRDGIAALIDAGVVTKTPTSQAEMRAVQAAYNTWMEESGLGLAAISALLAYSIDG